jgi:hypothetical protein
MAAGETTVQDILDGLAEWVPTQVEGLVCHSAPPTLIKNPPVLVFQWFAGDDTTLTHGSTQMWIIRAKATLYAEAIKGNDPKLQVQTYGHLIHPIVDAISAPTKAYPYGSKMWSLQGVDRVVVERVRPAEFGLEYAGHRYFGAELLLDIKMHRKVQYE